MGVGETFAIDRPPLSGCIINDNIVDDHTTYILLAVIGDNSKSIEYPCSLCFA